MFEPTSRYATVADARLTTRDADQRERVIVYKRRRFIPDAGAATTLVEHTVTQGERLDNLTARYLGDPTLFWQVCDANGALHPAELEELGRVVRIALPGL
ncbi:MAG: hypothetical protein RMK84_16320 [Oscillochloridaceae bacterium]|nr:hypothetical protein [Chloroflexaceae bacterium]MDW8391692.1 hypothetical protein [Oscillochloridaceae bacterium]